MSQWHNKYSVLSNSLSDSNDDSLSSSELVTETHTSETISTTEYPGSSTLPDKIYILAISSKTSTQLDISLRSIDSGIVYSVKALLDCGATGLFLDSKFVQHYGINTRKLPRAIPVYNVDGTLNRSGSITEEVDFTMIVDNHTEKATFAVCDLGDKSCIIGHTWLYHHNPEVDWRSGEVEFTRCPSDCQVEVKRQRRRRYKQNLKQRKHPLPLLDELEHSNTSNEPEDDTDGTDDSESDMLNAKDGDRIFVSFISTREYIRATSTVSQKLAEEVKKDEPKKSFEELVPNQYHGFRKVFDKQAFDKLPERKPWDHAIELKPGSEPNKCKIYPLSPNEQKELDAFLDENLKSGRIKPSKSPMASPVFFIKKKDGTLRLVQDYRKLNDMTIKNAYPLPLISDIISKLKKAKYFTKLDVRWGYNNVRIKDGDEWKAAFRTNRGLYEPLVMFFGLTNSPATFQTMMNDLFVELIDEGVVIVYMDDILIFTETLDHHREIVTRVLQILADNNLFLKAEKCEFERLKIEYLGLIISQGQIEMDPVKIEGVAKWPEPKNVTNVQSFLGFTNFYRRFIEDYAKIARPLHDLTKKNIVWTWGEREADAFLALKHKVTSAPILTFPDDHKPYKVEADSSNYATGAVLSQMGNDGKWHPVAYLSKSLNSVERNYEIHDKELLAIIRALEEWRHYLEGAEHKFEIWTDHKNLEYFKTTKKLNRRQARWSLYLSRFDFALYHRPGKSSGKPDALSRRSDHGKGESDNENVTLLKPEYFQIQALRQGHVLLEGAETDLLRQIRNAKVFDEQVVKAVKQLKTSSSKKIEGQEWEEEQGLILYRGKVYVPQDADLRRQIIAVHHDSPVAGHPGKWKTIELVSRNYWWPGLSRQVALYTKTCDRCNQTKVLPAKPRGKLTPTQIPKDIWQTISVDLITGLPSSHGYNAIMVVVDRLSKLIHVVPTTDNVTSYGVARLYRDNVWKHHGLPEEIISDRGSIFISLFMKELNSILGIKTSASTAYHPQTDGQTERVNQEVEQYLRLFVNHRQDDWAEWLALAEFTYNNRIQSSTRQTPFMLNNGRHPRMGTEPFRKSKVDGVDQFVDKMTLMRQEATSALHKAADDMAKFYDRTHGQAPSYQVGDKVWLDGKDLRTNRPNKKLDDRRYGPFTVIEVIGPNSYKLGLPASMAVHPVFHTVKLSPYTPDPFPTRDQFPRPAPLIEGDNPEWDVEFILDSRRVNGQLEYLVKWTGYPKEESTWEPVTNLKNAKPDIRLFYRNHPDAIRSIHCGKCILEGG